MWFAATAVGRRRAASVIFFSPFIGTASSVVQHNQKRTIYSKYVVPDYEKHRLEPWPYKERGYRSIHQWIDFGVSKRLGENSKLIIVEGNVGSGKSKLAKDLADRLGFHHIPDPPFDELFIDSYGDDRRLHYHLFPETVRFFDTRMFYEQPHHRNVAEFQRKRFQCRVEAYLNALAHIMNTGGGVVLERCWQTDKIFEQAMHNKGYLSEAFHYFYHNWLYPRVREDVLLEAHCVIYLDCPVSKCMENIKKHHKPWEWQNDVMDYKYLEDMDRGLKRWLKEYSRHAEILTYDWTDGGDANAVAEDLERTDLDNYNSHRNEKYETWHIMEHEVAFDDFRYKCTSNKFWFLQHFFVKALPVEELFLPVDDIILRLQMMNILTGKFMAGYKPERGDSRYEMMISFFRGFFDNKKWTEYIMKDEHHVVYTDVNMNHPGPPPLPTFPAEFLEPQSPYKSDGGCMARAELFLDESGRIALHGH